MSIISPAQIEIFKKENIKVDKDTSGKSYTNESIFEFLVNRKANRVPDGIETTAFSGVYGGLSMYTIGSGSRREVIKALGFSDSPTQAECDAAMQVINLEAYPGRRIQVHKALAGEVQGIFWELRRAGVNLNDKVGGYCFRPINNPNHKGSKTLSMHSFGCAIDINYDLNPFIAGGRPQTSGDDTSAGKVRTMDSPIVRAFAKYGWGWGGRYGDYMHFSKANGG